MGNICHAGPVLRSSGAAPPSSSSSSANSGLRSAKPAPTFGRDPTLKREDFIFSNVQGPASLVKLPGSVNGQQFLIEGCRDCDIFVLDHCTAVQIDDCANCRIVIGACDASLFVRNATNCTLVAAAQQFRTRDCEALDVYLYSTTEPILELSTKVRVACFPLTYFSLQQQFDKAGFSVWNNRWSEIFNFTPDHGSWKALSTSCHASPLAGAAETHRDGALSLWTLPSTTAEEVGLSLGVEQLVVPLTSGVTARREDEKGIMVVFPTIMLEFVQAMTAHTNDAATPPVLLIRTRQMKLTAPQAKSLLLANDRDVQRALDAAKSSPGSVIMEFQGAQCADHVASVLQSARFAGDSAAASAVVLAEPHYRRACELAFVEWKETV